MFRRSLFAARRNAQLDQVIAASDPLRPLIYSVDPSTANVGDELLVDGRYLLETYRAVLFVEGGPLDAPFRFDPLTRKMLVMVPVGSVVGTTYALKLYTRGGTVTFGAAVTIAGIPASDPIPALNPTAYLKDFVGLPWVGTASGGTSGAHTFDVGSASVGAAFGAHVSADLNGTTDYLRDMTNTLGDLVSASAFTLQWIAQFDTAGADDATPDNEAAIFSDTSGWLRINYSVSGARVCIYPVSNTPYAPLATGTKACIQAVLNAGTLKVRVNGGAWRTYAGAASNIGSVGSPPQLGGNYSLTHKIDGRLAQFVAWDTALSDATLDVLYADAHANYAAA